MQASSTISTMGDLNIFSNQIKILKIFQIICHKDYRNLASNKYIMTEYLSKSLLKSLYCYLPGHNCYPGSSIA